MYKVLDMHIYFSTRNLIHQLDRQIMVQWLGGILWNNAYRSWDKVFRFVAAFIDRGTGNSNRPLLTTGHTLCSNMWHRVFVGSGKFPWTKAELNDLNGGISNFATIVVDTFNEHCSRARLILKFQFLDRAFEGLHSFGPLSVFYTLSFEHYNMLTRTLYRRNSKRVKTRMEDCVEVLLSCDWGIAMGETSTHPVHRASIWTVLDQYSCLLIKKCHMVADVNWATRCSTLNWEGVPWRWKTSRTVLSPACLLQEKWIEHFFKLLYKTCYAE